MTATFETLMALDTQLAAAGHQSLTPWWRETLRRFYNHPTANTLVARVGRGGIKSTTASKFAVNEVLFGDFEVPPGEVHYWVDVSENMLEATQRLRQYEAYLDALGIPFDRKGSEIELPEMRRGFLVRACQVGRLSGFRSIGGRGDEVSKWRAADSVANPAPEVVASMTAMMVTHQKERVRKLLLSSPLGRTDYHYKRFAMGDTDDQVTAFAPTWEANPTVTEADTRRLEPDERIWKREYAAIPQEGALAAFDADAVERAFVSPVEPFKLSVKVGIIDASSGKKDTWSWAWCGWADVGGKRRLVFERVDGIEGAFWGAFNGDQIVERVAEAMKVADVRVVNGDQRESLMLSSAFGRRGLGFREWPWTSSSKELAVAHVRRWFAEDRVLLPEHEKMRAELLNFEERFTSAGALTFGARGSGHDDYVALLITAAMVDRAGKLPGSPTARSNMLVALEVMLERERREKAEEEEARAARPPGFFGP